MLNRSQLKRRIRDEGLIQNYVDLEKQLTPQGFDLTAGEIHRYSGRGSLDFTNENREIPETEKLRPQDGVWNLEPGSYKVKMNEKVDIPNDLAGLAFPRSSLLRMGCTVENAVWDAGFTGTGSFMLDVRNGRGLRLEEDARLNQLVFFKVEETEGYTGRYQE